MRKQTIKNRLQDIATKLMKGEYGDLYNFTITEDDNSDIVIIDHTEESYEYDFMLKDFRTFLEANGMFLECECPGRYIVCK